MYDVISDSGKSCDRVKLVLHGFSDVSKSGQFHHTPSKGLGFLSLLKQHKTGVIVEHPVAVCTCYLGRTVLFIHLGSITQSWITIGIENVCRSDETLYRNARFIEDLPSLVLVVHVGIGNAAERVLFVHLHDGLLVVGVRLIQRLQGIKRGCNRKEMVLCANILGSNCMSTFHLGLEDVHVFLHTDLGERMEVITIGNEFLAHSSTSLCERKACERLGECVIHSDTEIDDAGSRIRKCELKLRSNHGAGEHTNAAISLSLRDVLPCVSVFGHFDSELGAVKVALCEVTDRKRTAKLGAGKCEASDIVPEACESGIVRSCRCVRREVLRRVLQRLVHLLQTIVVDETCRDVPRRSAVGLQSVGLGLERLVGCSVCRTCGKSVDKSSDSVTGNIAGSRICVGRIHVHSQVARKRLGTCKCNRSCKRRCIVLFQRVIRKLRRIVGVRRVGARQCNLVAGGCCTLVEISNLRGGHIEGTAADVANTGQLCRVVGGQRNSGRGNSRRCTCVVEQVGHGPRERALGAVVVCNHEVEAAAFGEELLHVERERRLAHVAYSRGSIGFCSVAGDGACDAGVAGSRNSASGRDSESCLSLNIALPVDDLSRKGTVLLLKVDIACSGHSDVLRGGCSGIEARMRRSCSPVTDAPGVISRRGHNHALGRDAGI